MYTKRRVGRKKFWNLCSVSSKPQSDLPVFFGLLHDPKSAAVQCQQRSESSSGSGIKGSVKLCIRSCNMFSNMRLKKVMFLVTKRQRKLLKYIYFHVQFCKNILYLKWPEYFFFPCKLRPAIANPAVSLFFFSCQYFLPDNFCQRITEESNMDI